MSKKYKPNEKPHLISELTPMMRQYFETHVKYEAKFGSKTVVLMECGSFYEVYGVILKSGKMIGNVSGISSVLNIQKTRRAPFYDCAGFPTHATKRFIDVLIKNGYTIILIEQTTPPPNPKREITKIFSPGTYIDDIENDNHNNLLSIYLEQYKDDYLIGLSLIDLSTGGNIVYEYGNNDLDMVAGELYRFIESNSVKEIVLNSKKITDVFEKQVISVLDNSGVHYHSKFDAVPKPYYKLDYQNQFLKKIFPQCGLLSPLEYLDLCFYPLSIISYLLLIQFAYEHDERIVEKISRPATWKECEHMILSHNTLYQLDVIDYKGKYEADTVVKSLYSVLNSCYTAMGRRLLHERLLSPIVDPEELEERYERLDYFIGFSDDDKYIEVCSALDNIIDVERLVRKLMLKRLAPNAFSESWISFESINKVLNLLCGKDGIIEMDNKVLERYDLFIKSFSDYFDQKEMLKHNMVNIKGSFFKKGVYSEVDDLQEAYENCYQKLVDIKDYLSNMLDGGIEVEINNTKCDGYFLKTTTTRSNVIKKKLKKCGEEDKYQFKKKQSNSSTCRIYSTEIIDLSSSLIEIQEDLVQITHKKYLETLEYLAEEYGELLRYIISIIAEIDLYICFSCVSKKYGYCRPKIGEKRNDGSYLKMKEIRHPVIERVLKDYTYVPNDLNLSQEDNGIGLLLYGINGSGKSSLSKAIGLNIIMAQMGMYVAATEFEYYPFKTIFTRISDGDNIFKGYSSFAVEMNDLRTLIRYGNEWSLVLGDEVCKGTENVSAVSIVVASLQHFVANQVKFIFATHLHQVPKLECIKELSDSIKVRHLSVDCSDEKIVYGRKLLEGQGPSVYGLEVAKHIIHNDQFIKKAEIVRKQLMGISDKVLEEKSSKYNADLYVDHCEICGDNKELDVHHIKFQSECDQDGLYKHIPKNMIGNLVVLCKDDHVKVHQGKLQINGWISGSEGRKLDWHECKVEEIKEKRRGRLKYSEEDVKIIMESKEMKGLTSMNNILIWLKDKKGYKLSLQTLKKIWEGKYFV